jgi:hypothetical protein
VPAGLAVLALAAGLLGSFDHDLGRRDADTLEPIGPRLEIAEPHARGVLSPDGDRLALGVSESAATSGPRVGLWIVAPDTMRVVHRVGTGIAAEAVAYPGVVAALLQNGVLVTVDPRTGGIVRRKRLGTEACFPHPAASYPGGAAFAVVGAGRQVRLALVGARGRVRVIRLGRLRPGARCGAAGLAVDPVRRRAFVAAGSRVAEVALGSLRTRYHATGGPSGGRRTAAWLPGVGLAVAGPGLRVFGARGWRVRWRDRRAESVEAIGDAVVAAGGGRIRVFERDGRRRFTVRSPGHPFTEVAAGRLYVGSGGSLRVFDLASGAVRARHPPTRNSFWFTAGP